MPVYAWLITAGIAAALGTFLVPLLLPPPETVDSKSLLIRFTDHGLSLAALLLACGLISMDVQELGVQRWGWGRAPFDGVIGLLLAFAGLNSWSRVRRKP